MSKLANGKMAKRLLNPSRLPIIQRRDVELEPSEQDLVKIVASEILGESRNHAELSYFQPQVQQGLGDTSYIFFGDNREIRLFGNRNAGPIEYRLSVLAGEGDLVVIGGKQNRDFEQYLERDLGLGRREYLYTGVSDDDGTVPTLLRCLNDINIYKQLRTKVEERGGATLVAHISTGTVWALARKLGRDTGLPIHVAGPRPSLTVQANDKLWFTSLTTRLFGKSSVPPTYSVFGKAALAGRVHSLARDFEKIVIKIRDSAGSAGNFPILSADIAGMGVKKLYRHLDEMITDVVDHAPYPILVQVWKHDVLTSPSIQLWIPLAEDGPPVIEGIFEQNITGQAGRFSGAMPAILPDDWDFTLSRGSLILGYVMQTLGYFGRCSFDTIISGEDFGSASLHWIECNGRWGGVSVPMSLMNLLFAPDKTPAYIISHNQVRVPLQHSSSSGLDKFKTELWHPGAKSGIIFISPISFDEGSALIFLSLAARTKDALNQADAVFQRLAEIT